MANLKEGTLTKQIYNNFVGGVNNYIGSRQIKDSESPNATNCDFKGKGGIGSRSGYTQVSSVTDSRTKIYGMAEYHTSTIDQLIKFASNGSNVALYWSTGGSWTAVTGTTFTDALNMDVVQATPLTSAPTPGTPVNTDGFLFSFNGTDAMAKYDGSSWASYSTGTKGYYGAYFDKRLWCVDEQYGDVLNFSTQTPDATKPLDFTANGTASNPGTITIRPGSGAVITGIKEFKNSLYVFLTDSIYKIDTTSTANTFTITLVTNNIGCVSFRSIDQVGEDLFFAADDGVYSLGEVANYVSVRTTNKSARIQEVFDALSGASKAKLAANYHNFKYYLSYPLFGGQNDSCLVYDVRYQGWQDWRSIAAQSFTHYTNSTGDLFLYFGEPTTGKVHKMDPTSTTDDGTAISSMWYSKSFDEDNPDLMKLYFDTTFIFGDLGGSVTVSVIFDDSEVSATETVSQTRPQGGLGRDTLGRSALGDAVNTVTVVQVINKPQRLRAKGQKFAIQYRVTSSSTWRLDGITQTFIPFGHYKFPSANKLN